MTNKEQIAANWIFNHLPDAQNIALERLASLFRDNLLLTRRYKKCYCDGLSSQVQKFPIIYPLYPSEGEASKGIFNSVPFAYIAWLIPSNALPRIEVIETPISFSNLIFHTLEKEEIDKKLQFQGIAIIGSYKKVTNPISQDELQIVRKRALSKILELSGSDAHIYLSIFPRMPKILVEDEVSRYQKGLEIPQNPNSWEFQSQRVMPILFHKRLFIFTLNCWILTKKDLNI